MVKSYRPTEEYLHSIRQNVVIDASNCILGRLASKIAYILKGKHKVSYTPGTDCGDSVTVINSDQMIITGRKLDQNIFYKHTGYIGNMKETILKHRMEKDSSEVLGTAVKRMLPRGVLARRQFKRLAVFCGEAKCHLHKKTTFNFDTYFGGVNE